ncbi:Arm DNA-binding domain-containing protein [Mucilaginibacter sp.]
MLEKSLGLMFFLKQTRNYEGGEMYIYLKVTVDGVFKDLSVKRSWLPSRWNSKETVPAVIKKTLKHLMSSLTSCKTKHMMPGSI